MPIQTDTLNKKLYDLLKTQGLNPVPKDSTNKTTPVPDDAEIIKFQLGSGSDSEALWATIDGNRQLTLYYDDDVMNQSDDISTWEATRNHLKNWAMRKQLSFKLQNKDHLASDMAQRNYMKKKEQIGEGYYPMGKRGSFSDAVPNVKIVLQHSRQIEEGEKRYRNISKIFVENQLGERFAIPTNKPGLARVYARHIAEGGTPYDEGGKHITSLCEEYSKMAGFVRATRNGQFNESVQGLINEGVNHYQSIRETLHKLAGHRGYHAYFESWSPTLIEDATDNAELSEMFSNSNLDPRIESVMPILNKLHKKIAEMTEVDALSEWADQITGGMSATKKPVNEISAHDYDSDTDYYDDLEAGSKPDEEAEADERAFKQGLQWQREQAAKRKAAASGAEVKESSWKPSDYISIGDADWVRSTIPVHKKSKKHTYFKNEKTGEISRVDNVTGKHTSTNIKNREQGSDKVDEVSKATLSSYLDKAKQSFKTNAQNMVKPGPEGDAAYNKIWRGTLRKGINRATDRLSKDEQGVAEGFDEWNARELEKSRTRHPNGTGSKPSKTLTKLQRIPGFSKTSPAEQQRVAKAVDGYLARDMSFDQALVLAQKKGVAEGSTTIGGFGGSASQAQHEIQWIKNKIETLKPLLAKKPSVARQIKDLERQIRERELAIVYQKEGVAEGSLNEGQYEMMMRNGQVKKFIAKDDADAKRIAAGHGAKSVIKLKGGVPAGKVAEQGIAEGSGERKHNATWAQIADYEKRAKATSNEIKKQHLMKMASDLRRNLPSSDEQGIAEGLDKQALKQKLDKINAQMALSHPSRQNPNSPTTDRYFDLKKQKDAIIAQLKQGVTEAAQGHTIEAHGIRGMSRKPWHKTFKNVNQMNAWCEKYDAEVYGTRDLETAKQGKLSPAMEGKDPTTDSSQEARGSHRGEVKKNKDGSYVATNAAGARGIFKSEKAAKAHANSGEQGVVEGLDKQALKQKLDKINAQMALSHPSRQNPNSPTTDRYFDLKKQKDAIIAQLKQGVAESYTDRLSEDWVTTHDRKIKKAQTAHKADPTEATKAALTAAFAAKRKKAAEEAKKPKDFKNISQYNESLTYTDRLSEDDQDVTEGRMTHGPGGVPLDRQGNPKVAKPRVSKTSWMDYEDEDEPKPELDYDKIWFDVTNIIGNIFPDGDPADYLPKYCRKHGITYDDIRDAAKKNGYEDEYAYIDELKTGDYGHNLGEAMSQQQWEDDRAYKAMAAAKKDVQDRDPETARMRRMTDLARASGAIPPLAADAKSSSVEEAGERVTHKPINLYHKKGGFIGTTNVSPSKEHAIAAAERTYRLSPGSVIAKYDRPAKQGMEEGNDPFRGTRGGFNRGDDERHDLDPSDWYMVKDGGKMYKISIYPNQRKAAIAQGYSPTREEAKAKSQGVTEGQETLDTIKRLLGK